MVYTTKQQQAVLHCLEQRPEEALTATDLAADLRQAGHPVGLATIYRQLEKLEAAGCTDGDTVSIYDFEFEYQR